MDSTPMLASQLETRAALGCATCWGAQFQLSRGAKCIPDFIPGKRHFKSKFCDGCRDSILVPLSRLRALSTELAACFVNKRSEGFWNRAPKNMGGGQYRIINNTAGSIGPRLALFRDQPPAFNWPEVPESWVNEEGYVRLCVAKGTLVPAKTLRCGHPQASAKRSSDEDASYSLQQRSSLKRGVASSALFAPFSKRGCPTRSPSSSSLASFYSSSEQPLPPLQAQPCATDDPCALTGLEDLVTGLPQPATNDDADADADAESGQGSRAVVQAVPLPAARFGGSRPLGLALRSHTSANLKAASSAATAAARAATAAAADGMSAYRESLSSLGKASARAATTSSGSSLTCKTATLTLQQLKRPYEGGNNNNNHASLAPLEDLNDNLDLDSSSKSMSDESEAKRQKRMRRNRESAATSRERKKAYVEHLETKLAELTHIATMLRTENDALRASGRVLPFDKTAFDRVPFDPGRCFDGSTAAGPMPGDPTSLFVQPSEISSLLNMPSLLSSDSESIDSSPNDSESNDGTDQDTNTNHEKLEVYSPFEVFKLFSQEPSIPITV